MGYIPVLPDDVIHRSDPGAERAREQHRLQDVPVFRWFGQDARAGHLRLWRTAVQPRHRTVGQGGPALREVL